MIDEEIPEVGEIYNFIDLYLLPVGKVGEDLSQIESSIFDMLTVAKWNFRNKINHDPAMLLDLYLCCHEAGKPQLSFVSEWLYLGMLKYHGLRGKADLERLLGLKLKTRHTPYTRNTVRARHSELAAKVHFLRICGGLSVTDAIAKVTKIHAMDNQALKDLYYKHKENFRAWEESFRQQARDKDWLKDKLTMWGL